MKLCLKTRSDKSACANIFLELPLTDKCNIIVLIINPLLYIDYFILLEITFLTQPPEQNPEATAGDVL